MKKFNFFGLIILFLCSGYWTAGAEPLAPEVSGEGTVFSFNAPKAKKVSIAGEFNGWNKDKNPLKKDSDGIWRTTLPLKEGRTEYKFIIDGEWTEGDNFSIVLKKNLQTGTLEIPKGKPGIQSPYNQKVKFGGKYSGILPVDLKTAADTSYNPALSTPVNHVDLDWYVTPAEQADIFFRTELDTSRQMLNLLFKQGYLDFHPLESYFAKMYYNLKFIQFDDPLRTLDSEVGLRYEGVFFTDELNPHKAYGLDTQGLYVSARPLGLDFSFFYSNYGNYQQDDVGVRVKTKSGVPFGFGATYFANRGVSWPYPGGVWFPDPGYTLARATYTVPGTGIQPWYKGFIYRDFTAVDFEYDILPKMESGKIFFFAEYAVLAEELKATRWNEGAGRDSPLDKTWPVSNNNTMVAGLRAAFGGVGIEFSARNDSGKFRQSISSDPAVVDFKRSDDTGSAGQTVKAKYDSDGYSAGIVLSGRENKNFSSTIDAFLSPYKTALSFGGISNAIRIIVKKDTLVMPFVRINVAKKTNIKLIGTLHNYEVFPVTTSYFGANYLAPVVNHDSAAHRISKNEGILDLTQGITDNWFLEMSGRYSSYNFESSARSKSWFTAYAAIAWRLKENFMLRLGYGMDPEALDEDIKEDFDRREVFLYNQYLNYAASGSTRDAAIIAAEDALAGHQRISLRTEIRF